MDKPQLRSWQPAIFVLCYCPNAPKELSNTPPTKPCLWFWFKDCRKGSQYKGSGFLPLWILCLLWKGSKSWHKRKKPPTYNILKNHSKWTITRATWSYSIQLDGMSILSCPMKEISPISRMPFHTKRQFKHIFKGHRFHTMNLWTKQL